MNRTDILSAALMGVDPGLARTVRRARLKAGVRGGAGMVADAAARIGASMPFGKRVDLAMKSASVPLFLSGMGKALRYAGLGLKSKALGGAAGLAARNLRAAPKMVGAGSSYANLLKLRHAADLARGSIPRGLSGSALKGFNYTRGAGSLVSPALTTWMAYDVARNRAMTQRYEEMLGHLRDVPVSGRLGYLFNNDPGSLYKGQWQ